jgi:hypothetical protein
MCGELERERAVVSLFKTICPYSNRVLMTIFGLKREEMVRGYRRLHNEELHNLYASLNITRVIKSRRIRWAGHTVRMGAIRSE